jgi:hypothetical protein
MRILRSSMGWPTKCCFRPSSAISAVSPRISCSSSPPWSGPARQPALYPLPYVFTEQGVAMLSSVLNSERAIAINIEVMRAFVKLHDLLSSNRELARRFAQLETRLDKKLTEHDEAIAAILSAIRQLMGKSSTH